MTTLPRGESGLPDAVLVERESRLVGELMAELGRVIVGQRAVLERLLVGQPPVQYLAQWRMQVAANLLTQRGAKIAAIGAEVGYDSEAAFSRAFKKATGLAPGAWREARRSTRS
jgi:AraC-like DNA-binding protein